MATLRSCTARVAVIVGIVVLILLGTIFGFVEYRQRKAEALRSSVAVHMGLLPEGTWSEIQRALYCQVIHDGLARQEVETRLQAIGEVNTVEGSLDGTVVTYQFREPSVAEHIGLRVVYDLNETVHKRILLEGFTFSNSDHVERSFDCSETP